MNFKPHKIPSVNISICCKEQKIAYNYLFSWAINFRTKDYVLSCIQAELASKAAGTYEKDYKPLYTWTPGGVDYDLVYHYILQSFDRYTAKSPKIFTSYAEIASVIYSDVFKVEGR